MLKNEIQKFVPFVINNGLLSLRPATGEILTMVGSADFFASPSGSFNVTTAQRQPDHLLNLSPMLLELIRK